MRDDDDEEASLGAEASAAVAHADIKPHNLKITPAQAIKDLVPDGKLRRQGQKKFTTEFLSAQQKARELEKLRGLRDHFKHKVYWSIFLMWCMGGLVVFQAFLLMMVGSHVWDFTKYAWLLPTVMIQYLVQVVGLAVFVVRSLFKDMD